MNALAIGQDLMAWGWDDGWAAAWQACAGEASTGQSPARVVARHRGRWLVAGGAVVAATLSGRFRHTLAGDDSLPAVGDWVASRDAGHEATIEAVLPRRTAFRRRAAGPRAEPQVVAANVDTLFIAASLNRDLNERRLERYLAMARESGAEPVIVLTKADLGPDADRVAERLGASLRVEAVALSSRTGTGIDRLARWLRPGGTVALLGSSGVGKSTLLNRLAGAELAATRAIREDDARGRHATSHRELFRLPGGALLLDTPGLREVGLWDADDGLDATFTDVLELAAGCRFADCTHEREPGCAVRAALEDGRLDPGRFRSYRRLGRELADLPTPAERREASRKFGRMVRDVGASTEARKSYRWHES